MARIAKGTAAKNEADAFSQQWLPVLEAKWQWVDSNYVPAQVWGAEGSKFLLWHGALCSHGDLPLGCNALSLSIAASNGARTKLFGGKLKNLWAWFINENYPQTRKSETTGFLRAGARRLDQLISEDVLNQWDEQVRGRAAQHRQAGLHEVANACEQSRPEEPRVETVEIPNCTAPELWRRLSVDFNMWLNFDEAMVRTMLPHFGNKQRPWLGSLINDDEFYNKASELNLLTKSAAKLCEVVSRESTHSNYPGPSAQCRPAPLPLLWFLPHPPAHNASSPRSATTSPP